MELDWSLSKVLRIEAGQSRVNATDLKAMLAVYGVSDPTTITALVSQNRVNRTRTWLNGYRQHLPSSHYSFLTLEASAKGIRQYSSTSVPDLLRTESYGRALASLSYRDQEQVERVLALQRDRQQHLLGASGGPEISVLVDAAVLRRVAGSVEVYRDQLRHLKDMASVPRVSVQVVPLTGGAHRGMGGSSFTVLYLAGGEVAVGLENRSRGVVVHDKPATVDLYEDDFEKISQRALAAEATPALIDEALEAVPLGQW